MKRITQIVLACLIFGGCAGEGTDTVKRDTYDKISPASWRKLESIRDSIGSITNLDSLYEERLHPNGLPYHVFVPPALTPGETYPLVMFLHGYSDLDLTTHNGFPKGVWTLPAVQQKHPHIVFVPRHRTIDDDWTSGEYRAMVAEALEDLIAGLKADTATPHIDRDRVYLTGFSQGGKGTWDYIEHFPRTFAAAVPLSGYFNGPQTESEARAVEHIPIWIFNGSRDDGVEGSRASYRALVAAGARDVRYHEYVDHGHVIDDIAYFTDGFMEWLFSQKRNE